jgi:hypothetical protein
MAQSASATDLHCCGGACGRFQPAQAWRIVDHQGIGCVGCVALCPEGNDGVVGKNGITINVTFEVCDLTLFPKLGINQQG